jgi:hypothetical protein
MAEPTPVAPPEHLGDTLVYRPVSGLAIAGLALALLYTAMVLVSTAVALVQGTPFFLSDLTVLLAIAGAGLSLLGMWQIRTSEGTRAGLKVARWGLWLSIVSGSGYMAYAIATAAAIKQQANRFLTEPGEDAGFFPLLQKGDINDAFLLTQTYSRRSGANPRDQDKMRLQFDAPTGPHPTGWLTQLEESQLVRLFEQARLRNDKVSVEPAAVRGWSYEAKGYKVERTYRIATPETVADVFVTVQSVENDGTGAGRKWFVVWPSSGIRSAQDTPAGEKMSQLRWDGRGFIDAWLAKLNRGQRPDAFLDTLEPEKRKAAAKWTGPGPTWWWSFPGTGPAGAIAGMPLAVPPAPLLPLEPDLARRVLLPGYEEFLRGRSYLKADGLRASAKEAARVRADFEHSFQEVGATRLPFQLKLADPKLALWDTTRDGRLQITYEFQMPLVQDVPGQPRFLGKGRIVVETQVPGDPRTAEFTPAWRLERVELDRALPMPAQRPGPG